MFHCIASGHRPLAYHTPRYKLAAEPVFHPFVHRMEASQTDKTVVRQCADFYQSVYQPLISGPTFGVEDSETKEFGPGEDGVMKACWTCETSINVTNLSDTDDATVHVEGEFHKDTKPWDPPPIPPNESKSDRRYWGFQGVRIFNKSGRARIRVHVHW